MLIIYIGTFYSAELKDNELKFPNFITSKKSKENSDDFNCCIYIKLDNLSNRQAIQND